jgi:hypothetical protein
MVVVSVALLPFGKKEEIANHNYFSNNAEKNPDFFFNLRGKTFYFQGKLYFNDHYIF